MLSKPPQTIQELMERAYALAGYRLGDLANELGQPIPSHSKQAKGWAGQLIEMALGATAGARPEPDFPDLWVELKTIPVDEAGRVRESTFVCVADLNALVQETWENSLVKRKLTCVLWVPVLAANIVPLAERRIGMPSLWRPSKAEEAQLQQDWEELTDLIATGHLAYISARQGKYLQLRPKAANSRVLQTGFDETGEPTLTLPRGFYLRARFTSELIRHTYAI